jgi:hypothetical protein
MKGLSIRAWRRNVDDQRKPGTYVHLRAGYVPGYVIDGRRCRGWLAYGALRKLVFFHWLVFRVVLKMFT